MNDAAYLGSPVDAALYAQIVRCEGLRTHPYADAGGAITVGIGWNLSANGLPSWAIQGLYNEAVADAEAVLDRLAPWWEKLDDVRQRALVNLAFNLGNRLEGFPRFLADMQAGLYAQAAAELETSQPWFSQVGQRGPMVAQMIRTGKDPEL